MGEARDGYLPLTTHHPPAKIPPAPRRPPCLPPEDAPTRGQTRLRPAANAKSSLFNTHANVLILDEPTSALDKTSRDQVLKLVGEVAKGKTLGVIDCLSGD